MITFSAFCAVLSRVYDAGVGPDGVPYSGWQSERGYRVLFGLMLYVLKGCQIPLDIVRSLLIYIVKRMAVGDFGGAKRKPSGVRPINLKNSGVKLVSVALNWTLNLVMSKRLYPAQRGFINSRNFLLNAVELDATARIFSRHSPRCIRPVVASGNKWKSISHDVAIRYCESNSLNKHIALRNGDEIIEVKDIRRMVFFDFANAFPSVAHEWMHMALSIA